MAALPLNGPIGVISGGTPVRLKRHRFGATTIRLLSVTAAAAAACALWAGTASAATASVAKHSTTTSISVPKRAYDVSWVRLSASVSSSGGSRARGTVTFKWGKTKLCSGRLVLGKTHCRVAFVGPGTVAVRAYYGGNAAHKASASGKRLIHIVRAPTVTKITNAKNGTVVSGGAFKFNVTVSAPAGVVAPDGKVVVTPTSPTGLPFAKYGCDATIRGGKGSCTIHPPAYGLVTYKATYQGNVAWKSSTYAGPYDLFVQNATTTTIAATSTAVGDVSLTASVYAMGNNVDELNGGLGSVTIYIGTTAANVQPVTGCAGQLLTNFTGPPDNDNTYTCDANKALNALKAGTYYISAVYSGDQSDEGSSSDPPTPITIS
jgi:Bacterial Ig-like domain (group 3)